MQEDLLFLDFETTSRTDLKLSGLGRYLADPSTRGYCFTFQLPDMSSVDLWTEGTSVPKQICQHLARGGLFVAHNAPFDFWIWNTVLRRTLRELPQIHIGQVRCSAVRARYNGLPGSLEGACAAMGLPIQKDMEGSRYMKEIAANPDWTPASHPEHFGKTYKYAIVDTAALVGLWGATIPIPPQLQREFELDMQINARGFGVDVEAAQAMEDLKLYAEAALDYQLTMLTGGGLFAVAEVQKIKQYVIELGGDLDTIGREEVKKLVTRGDLPADVRAVLELRLDASRAPKKSAAILRAHVNNRMQHSTVFYGALSGRSTARGAGGAQLLNVARPRPGRSSKDCEAYLEAARRKDIAYLSSPGVGPILAALADAQRPLFRAVKPGHVLIGADWSGIEARMSAWLANDEEKLTDFETGVDGYVKSGAAIFNMLFEELRALKKANELRYKEIRQVGKVADLALTYGGGAGAFANMAANYGVHLPPEQIDEIVLNWRIARPAYERWWSMLEYAALCALDAPGREVSVPVGCGHCAHVTFIKNAKALRMFLPSGRAINYHNARLHLAPGADVPVAVYDKPKGDETPGGFVETLDRKILSNNLTQGSARDAFWELLCDVDQVEPVVHHVYDELLLEVPESRAEERKAQLLARMQIPPSWAPRLPLEATGYINHAWRKD